MRRFKEITLGWLMLVVCGLTLDRPLSLESKTAYVGSEKCAGCHAPEFGLWKNSLHSKMYQKPGRATEVILGDFSIKDPLLTFKKEDIAYTIGSRWEQLYVTIRAGEDYLLPAKWLVGQRKWAPLDAEHAKKLALSKYCHGCHTTSFDPATNKFAEMNIGCEACHGPGSRHVQTASRSDIIHSQNPDVCGRCHTRGKDVNAGLDFVVQFDPREKKLSEVMAFSQPGRETTRNWWANAVERDRHQEYLGYLQSGHAKSLERLRNFSRHYPERVTPACYACHASEYNLAREKTRVSTSELKYGVTCIQCHDPHGGRTVEAAGQNVKGKDDACLTCHFVRGLEGHSAKRHHYPCPQEAARCIDCHMPVTGITAAEFNIRSHTLKIITPQEAEKLGMPSSCNNSYCHSNKSLAWLKEKFSNSYAGGYK